MQYLLILEGILNTKVMHVYLHKHILWMEHYILTQKLMFYSQNYEWMINTMKLYVRTTSKEIMNVLQEIRNGRRRKGLSYL